MNNNLGCAVDVRKNASKIIKTRLEETEEDIETNTKTLRINKEEVKGLGKEVLEDCIIGCGYGIIGSTECYDIVKGNRTKRFYEFYVVKKEFAGVC